MFLVSESQFSKSHAGKETTLSQKNRVHFCKLLRLEKRSIFQLFLLNNQHRVKPTSLLIVQVWKLYKEGVVAEAIDPLLQGDFPEHEALEVLQIGLLCTQASATLRPSMDEVVEFLTTKGEDREIPVPHQPPFLNARALVSQSQGLSSSTSNSSPLTKLGISYTTTSQSSTAPSSEWPLRIDELSSSQVVFMGLG